MPDEWAIEVDDAGRVILPPELAQAYGLVPGARGRAEAAGNELRLRRSSTHLAKVYIEPTNHCNLECVTCMRHGWDEPVGRMSDATFAHILSGLQTFSPPPQIFFGGLGEPLSHPDIVAMVREAKRLGSTVELITNGTLLTRTLSRQLMEAGLDMLWVSLDGATPESYKDVRLGSALPQVLANLVAFREVRWTRSMPELSDLLLRPHIGIVFVAMKRNIADLPAVLQLASRLGALHFLVTNVLPYTPEMQREILYGQTLKASISNASQNLRTLSFPRMDVHAETREILGRMLHGDHALPHADASPGAGYNRCPFLDKGALAIRWDGDVSPCLALLHDHRMYVYDGERSIRRHAFGNVAHTRLDEIWNKPEYGAFRRRLEVFDFSPCLCCGGCDYFESNQEDCIGSPAPACGGCLWAQGIIQCP